MVTSVSLVFALPDPASDHRVYTLSMMSANRVSEFEPESFTLYAWCVRCQHDAALPRPEDDPTIPQLKQRLRCRKCGSTECGVSIVYTGAGGFAYSQIQ